MDEVFGTHTDDDVDARQFLQQERCLLYVACSRARDRLAVSWTGDPSPFLAQITQESPEENQDS